MKQFKIILSMAIAVFCITAVNAQSGKTKVKQVTKDTAVYQCPMKCEGDKTYDKAGKCPVCNMNLKAISKPVTAVYQCPMKCEGDKTYSKDGKCPVCNMKLSKVEAKKETQGHDGHNHK
jgi:transcription initiation factor IIE alpha subunit